MFLIAAVVIVLSILACVTMGKAMANDARKIGKS